MIKEEYLINNILIKIKKKIIKDFHHRLILDVLEHR